MNELQKIDMLIIIILPPLSSEMSFLQFIKHLQYAEESSLPSYLHLNFFRLRVMNGAHGYRRPYWEFKRSVEKLFIEEKLVEYPCIMTIAAKYTIPLPTESLF